MSIGVWQRSLCAIVLYRGQAEAAAKFELKDIGWTAFQARQVTSLLSMVSIVASRFRLFSVCL